MRSFRTRNLIYANLRVVGLEGEGRGVRNEQLGLGRFVPMIAY